MGLSTTAITDCTITVVTTDIVAKIVTTVTTAKNLRPVCG